MNELDELDKTDHHRAGVDKKLPKLMNKTHSSKQKASQKPKLTIADIEESLRPGQYICKTCKHVAPDDCKCPKNEEGNDGEKKSATSSQHKPQQRHSQHFFNDHTGRSKENKHRPPYARIYNNDRVTELSISLVKQEGKVMLSESEQERLAKIFALTKKELDIFKAELEEQQDNEVGVPRRNFDNYKVIQTDTGPKLNIPDEKDRKEFIDRFVRKYPSLEYVRHSVQNLDEDDQNQQATKKVSPFQIPRTPFNTRFMRG